MSKYVIVWKDREGPRVTTTVNDSGAHVLRDEDYVTANSIETLHSEEDVLAMLSSVSDKKYAVPEQLASSILGWSV